MDSVARIRATPEEAARGEPVYEVETVYCGRVGDGWEEEQSSNGTIAFLPTGLGVGTLVMWDEAPSWAVAARYKLRDQEHVVPIESGFSVVCFDDVSLRDWDRPHAGWPDLATWVDSSGAEHAAQ